MWKNNIFSDFFDSPDIKSIHECKNNHFSPTTQPLT
jgi:hypothetical protein